MGLLFVLCTENVCPRGAHLIKANLVGFGNFSPKRMVSGMKPEAMRVNAVRAGQEAQNAVSLLPDFFTLCLV